MKCPKCHFQYEEKIPTKCRFCGTDLIDIKFLDRINPEKIANPVLVIMAIGCVIALIGLPFIIFNNMLIFQIGISLIGIGTFFLVIIAIIISILSVIEMSYCVIEDMKKY